MESIISTFHIDWKIVIAQAVNFSIVFVILYIYALKPLSKLMEERAQKISKGISDAKTNEEILKDTSLKYEEALTKARMEASKIFDDAKKEAENKKTIMLEEAKTQVSVMIDNGKKMLENEKVKMVGDARKEIINLTMLATEKLIGSRGGSFDDQALKELNNL